jgi:serine protease Do
MRFQQLIVMAVTLFALALPALAQNPPAPPPVGAPASFADLADRLLPAVVNISTTQKVKPQRGMQFGLPEMPQFPPGSPFEDFFRDFLSACPKTAITSPRVRARRLRWDRVLLSTARA